MTKHQQAKNTEQAKEKREKKAHAFVYDDQLKNSGWLWHYSYKKLNRWSSRAS